MLDGLAMMLPSILFVLLVPASSETCERETSSLLQTASIGGTKQWNFSGDAPEQPLKLVINSNPLYKNAKHLDDHRNCTLLAEDDCTFKTESATAEEFNCGLEHASRLMYLSWIRPDAKVLEVGARYGQTSCLLSRILQRKMGAVLFSSDADPKVWDVLKRNEKDHGCWGSVVRGPVGKHAIKVAEGTTYGTGTFPEDDPAPGRIVPAIPLSSLGTKFDTLAIDCEGCLPAFLEENAAIMDSLSMIVGEIHNAEENQAVEQLLANGWELKQAMRRQRVLCKGSCDSMCDQNWVKEHAVTYWAGDVEPAQY